MPHADLRFAAFAPFRMPRATVILFNEASRFVHFLEPR